MQDMEHQQLCNKTLDSHDLDMLRTAVARDFYFQVQGMLWHQAVT
jgi:hypothetical protein